MNPKLLQSFARILPSLALAEWGSVLTYFYCSGRLAAYLHPNFRLSVFITGIMLLISAACVLSSDKTCSQLNCDDAGCKATSLGKITLGGLLPFVVLLLPIALAAKITPDSFGAGLVQNRGVRQTISGEAPIVPGTPPVIAPETPPVIHDDYIAVSILDLMLAAQDPIFEQGFKGKRVGLTGRFMPKDATHCELICTLVTCCAVDAQLLTLRIHAKNIPSLDKLAWTKVIGRVSFVKIGKHDMPIIAAEKITAIPSPQEQFIYGPSRPIGPNRPAHF